ncbi:hypothetical protein CRUP_032813, partial [Coryphaenoides rupestris]
MENGPILQFAMPREQQFLVIQIHVFLHLRLQPFTGLLCRLLFPRSLRLQNERKLQAQQRPQVGLVPPGVQHVVRAHGVEHGGGLRREVVLLQEGQLGGSLVGGGGGGRLLRPLGVHGEDAVGGLGGGEWSQAPALLPDSGGVCGHRDGHQRDRRAAAAHGGGGGGMQPRLVRLRLAVALLRVLVRRESGQLVRGEGPGRWRLRLGELGAVHVVHVVALQWGQLKGRASEWVTMCLVSVFLMRKLWWHSGH